jgi:hypothetical protein
MPVTDDYAASEKNKFQGTIHWVRIVLEDDDVSHPEPGELNYQPTMERQQFRSSV